MHKLYIKIIDSVSSGNIIDISTEHITISHIYIIIEELENMLTRFNHSTLSYYTIINDTINSINIKISEIEGNTTLCTISKNLQYHNVVSHIDDFISSFDEDTIDVSIDSEVPINAIECSSIRPFLYLVNTCNMFSYEIHSRIIPNWNHILKDLGLL